eukprot:TRINITY_DN14121_c0_g1_i2.p1 TRINITY_DN14121_c0_g1~~TRINITY_DN14121_c0_g1_i2.p1  ORF type:complete len:221 (-),score=39.33 TRINITY_DN14121_c0_g1_i2:296-958(-)
MMGEKLWERFGHNFYGVNLLILMSFLAVRLRLGHKMSASGDQQDRSMWGMFLVMMMVRFRRMPSIESFLSMVFLYSKVLMLVSCYLMDQRLAIIYATLFLMTFMVLEQPCFEGSFPVPDIDEDYFEEYIGNKKVQNRSIIYCYAPKHGGCKEVAPIISELAERYQDSTTQFFKLDITKHRSLAAKLKLANTRDAVPLYIMYKKVCICLSSGDFMLLSCLG